jgi:hypothetical protein
VTLALTLALLAAAAGPAPSPSPSPQAQPGAATSLLLFAGTESGLWRSRNWGGEWERVVAEGLKDVGAVHSVVTVGAWVFLGSEGGLYISEDFGGTWQHFYDAGPVLAITASRYFQADPTVLIGTPRGLLKSEDGGRSFHETPLKTIGVQRMEWPGPDLLAAGDGGLWLSPDGGAQFRRSERLPDGPVHALALSSYYAVDPVLFVGVGTAGVFRSSDGGQRWAAAGLQGRTVADLVWLGPMLYAATDAGLERSVDNGATWSPLSEGIAGRQAFHLLFPLAPANGAEAFLGTDRGVYWSGDGGTTWRPSGLSDQVVGWVATFPPPEPVVKKK